MIDSLDDAQTRLMKLIAAGTAPDWVFRQVGVIIAGWAGEPKITPSLVRWRIEKLWDTFTREAVDLQAAISDEPPADPALACRVMSAMDAAVEPLEAALG